MATKILMEALSPTMEEGRLVEWKKQEGDTVAAGDILAEVETDKAVMDLQARAPGILLKQVAAAGATVPVGNLVGVIGDKTEDITALLGASAPARPAAAATPPKPAAPAPKPAPAAVTSPAAPAVPAAAAAAAAAAATTAPAPAGAASPRPSPADTGSQQPQGDGGRLKASPLARKSPPTADSTWGAFEAADPRVG